MSFRYSFNGGGEGIHVLKGPWDCTFEVPPYPENQILGFKTDSVISCTVAIWWKK